MKNQTQTSPMESWASNDHWVRKLKYVKQKGLKKVHTTTVDQDQMQVGSRAYGREKKCMVFRKHQPRCFC